MVGDVPTWDTHIHTNNMARATDQPAESPRGPFLTTFTNPYHPCHHYTRQGSWLEQLTNLLRRLEDLSHVLAWAKLGGGRETAASGVTAADVTAAAASVTAAVTVDAKAPAALSLVELPRLRLSFEVRVA